jgi:hypothetical protein
MTTPLSPYVAAQSNLKAVYFVQGKTKRPVPNDATLRFILQQVGLGVRSVPDAVVAQLVTGAPLPARNDGIVYRGPAGTLDLMQGGLRRRIPDTTTQRSVGAFDHAPIAISAADLATIPAGAAFPSASWFAQPPQANVPITFLPLRIETRFGKSSDGKPELWVRVFPDDIHVNSFEPGLTAAESAARAAFLADPGANGTDPDLRLAAWARIARQFGPARAAWIVAPAAGTSGSRASDWTRAPNTALLPDRFIFCAYDAEGGVIRQPGAEIADGTVLGPSPAGGDPATDEGLRWTRDFQRAVDLGLAARLAISAAQAADGFTRVMVFGVKSRLDPVSAAQRLGDALDAHHFTSGIELLPVGTPTNNAEGTRSGYAGDDPGFARSFAVERGRPRTPSPGRRDGDRLAAGLGITAARFAFVRGAEGRHDDAPTAMNTVLWPATLGYYLGQLVTGAVPDPASTLSAARAHFIAWVRARGPWPTLRIGRQPYGVLPVLWSGAYQPIEGTPVTAQLMSLLQLMRPTWRMSAARVARVGRGGDPDATLAAVLGLAPSSTSYAGRTVLGPQFNQYYWQFIGQPAASKWWTQLQQSATAGFGTAAQIMASTRIANATYLGMHFSLSSKLVAQPLTDAALADNYLTVLGAMTFDKLRDVPPPPQPAPLLALLVRHAALRQYADTAYELLGEQVPAADRLDAEVFNLTSATPTPSVWNHLGRTLADGTLVGAYLDQHKLDGPAAFVEFWHALGTLRTLSTTELDRVLRESFDLCSHRLDAWYTSLASLRLDWLRKQPHNQQTLYLGAYGWVEDVRPQPGQTSWGYVHAPSLGHAATAAVLRSGYLTHQDSANNAPALRLDLSSGRVRKAQHLLDGVRAGQPLGALLGYQFERALHVRHLDAYISNFRIVAPVEGVAGDHVVDGLKLLEQLQNIPWGSKQGNAGVPLPARGTPTKQALDNELSLLNDALDAVSDLMLAESVYQLVGGSALRAGATVDALGRGESPPPVLDVTRTPRRGGVITHRLLVLLPDGPAAGWPLTPRGQAEPRLNAFVASLLGPPTRVRARAQIVSPAKTIVATVALTLADLGLGPLDIVALRERAPGAVGQSEIEQRLAWLAWSRRPAATPDGSSIVLRIDRDPAASPDTLSIDELLTAAASARALLAAGRGATMSDFASPEQPTDLSVDLAELKTRADAATAALHTARARFDDPTSTLDQALSGAALFGADGAVPDLDPRAWLAQAGRVRVDLDARLAHLAALEAGFQRASASPAELRDHELARFGIVFGPSFRAVPRLSAAGAVALPALFAASVKLLAGHPREPLLWLSRVARVRPGAARLDEALLHAEILHSGARRELAVAQLPPSATDVWAGLPLTPGTKPSDRISIVALGAPATAAAALFVDEWLETVPNASETTGVTFHIDDARSRAPQAILLGVQPDAFPEWTLESVEGTLLEAIELTHFRTVDPDGLAGMGHFLPALFFATNLGDGPPDTISTDLTLAAPLPRTIVTRPPILDTALGTS